MDEFKKRSKGFGFVEMPNNKEANSAIATLNKSKLQGNTIAVKETQSKRKDN